MPRPFISLSATVAVMFACSAANATAPVQRIVFEVAPVVPAAVAASKKADEPSVWDQTKTMTSKQWNKAKRQWAIEKVKWRACNREARSRKLDGAKSWTFIGRCMTR
jgi:hypothetical protein